MGGLIEGDLGENDPGIVELMTTNPDGDRDPRTGPVVEPGFAGGTVGDVMGFDPASSQPAAQ